jgi:hypothetical protein
MLPLMKQKPYCKSIASKVPFDPSAAKPAERKK